MTTIEHLDLVACGNPCPNCPVAHLGYEKRLVVDHILAGIGPEIDYDPAIYPWDDDKAATYNIPGEVNKLLPEVVEGMMSDAPKEETKLVLRAIVKIVNEGCPTYSEGEI
jgi:hypothetical protein